MSDSGPFEPYDDDEADAGGEETLGEQGFDRDAGVEDRHHEEMRAVEEAGGGESEGFELAEQELIEHTSHGDEHNPAKIMRDAGPEEEAVDLEYGEADEEHKPD